VLAAFIIRAVVVQRYNMKPAGMDKEKSNGSGIRCSYKNFVPVTET
jgi:hypothetical protein